jgi:hypothetical protein
MYILAIAVILIAVAFGLYIFLRSLQDQDRKAPDPKTPPRPTWANFFSLGEWEAFMREVRCYFDAKGAAYRLDSDGVYLEDGSMQYGLSNLAQVCRQLKRAEWTQFIHTHFSLMENSKHEEVELERRIVDFTQVKELLMVRLAAVGTFPPDAPLIIREDLPGTFSYLVFDLPSTVRSVSRDEAKAWGMSDAELFEVGLANVLHNARPEISQQEFTAGQEAMLLIGDSFFIASHALLLDKHPECLGKAGALVAIPHRHCLIAYPINTMEVVKMVDVMGIVAMGMEREGPGSISPRLYWYYDGTFLDLPFSITKDAFEFFPPDAFTNMLNDLAEESSDKGSYA